MQRRKAMEIAVDEGLWRRVLFPLVLAQHPLDEEVPIGQGEAIPEILPAPDILRRNATVVAPTILHAGPINGNQAIEEEGHDD